MSTCGVHVRMNSSMIGAVAASIVSIAALFGPTASAKGTA